MIRILVIDDIQKPEFIEELQRDLENESGDQVECVHLNPVTTLTGRNPEVEVTAFLDKVRQQAAEFWDVAAIDLNLHEVKASSETDKLHLALSIAEAFREVNRSATVIIYSGTLTDYVELLIASDEKESALRRIFRAETSGFTSRRSIGLEVASAVFQPPWLLVLDRALMEHGDTAVTPQESEFKGKTFAQLAAAVRCQNALGVRLTKLVAELGLGCIVDLSK